MNSLTPVPSQTLLDKIEGQASTAILRSWQRCAASDYSLHADPSPLLRADLQARREQYALMLQAATPEFETLASLAVAAQSVVLLADASGVILQEAGSTAFQRKAERVSLQSGVSWAESLRGTNAIGTALVDGTAVRVHGREHFMECNRVLSCHASPVFSSRGDILGVLNISSEATVLHAYALGLAQICSRQISNRMLDNTDARLHRLVFQRESSLLDSAERAILVLEDDRIVGANEAALRLLGSGWGLLDTSIQDWFDGWNHLGDVPQALRTCGGVTLQATLRHGKMVAAPGRHESTQAASTALPAFASHAHGSKARSSSPRTSFIERTVLAPIAEDLEGNMRHAVSAVNAGMAVLLEGETGAGKEVFARHLHAQSEWSQGPFVAINCGALPESLIESELFGYEAGAFTGARREGSRGRLREAQGGVLFLDEIGDMPLLLQTRLLRALQEREVQPLGSDKRIPVEFAVISASNRGLSAMIQSGTFRADLYYRLQDFSLRLPPLRDRHRLREFLCQEFKRLGGMDRAQTLADSALDRLAGYSWPGNYRELHSILRRLLFLHPPGSVIHANDLPPEVASRQNPLAAPSVSTLIQAPRQIDQVSGLRDINDQAIERAIAESNGNISKAARTLGVHRSTVYRYLDRKHNPQ